MLRLRIPENDYKAMASAKRYGINMPIQGTSADILKRALSENDLAESVTDECFLVEKLGIEVSITEGKSTNIKVTTREDLAIAEQILKR